MRSRIAAVLCVLVTAWPSYSASASAAERRVYVNNVRLGAAIVLALEAGYRTAIPNGRYWYDRRAGLWGRQGGPTLGRIQAGLELGGRLRADASGGKTGVYVNGRRLPAVELAALQRLVGHVRPGRYWLDEYGNAGLEGGPALINLIAAQRAAARRHPGGWNRNTPGGNWGGDGDCSYYSHPDGPSVMIGNC